MNAPLSDAIITAIALSPLLPPLQRSSIQTAPTMELALVIITETALTKLDMAVNFTALALANILAPALLILPQLPRQCHPLQLLKAVHLTGRLLLPPT